MIEYLKSCHGFEDENIVILMDDGKHTEPTSANIIAAYKQVVADSEPGDAVFCHYSGHGCSIKDDDYNEEEDGKDEALCPVDYASAGVIRDDDVFAILVSPMAKDVTLTCVMDCCHSGTMYVCSLLLFLLMFLSIVLLHRVFELLFYCPIH
jgi:hypothetical protein